MRTVVRAGVVTALLAVVLAWAAVGVVRPAVAAGGRADGDNPMPFINSLSPIAAVIGDSTFALTVDGVGFVPASQVYWNGQPRATTFVSTSQLAAQIDAADIATAQTAAVTVVNPLPGGGTSLPVLFPVQAPNPMPDVTGLSPAQALVGDDAFGITVIGSGFVPGSTVLWNGQDRTTGFINELMLTATIRAADVAVAGEAYVSVLNPAPGGGHSASARVFTIDYPIPMLAGLEPFFVWAGGPAFTLAVTGSRFTPASVVWLAGVPRPTVYVTPERLEAQVFAGDIAHASAASVLVFTPGPGGGYSVPLSLEVRQDDVPPVTEVVGLSGTWHRTRTTFTLVATDVGLGVQWTYYRIVDQSNYLEDGPTVVVRAPSDHSNDGLHTVQYRSVDKAGNLEPFKHVEVGIDTRPPTTVVTSARVARGATLRPRYRVNDGTSPRARDALLQVVNRAGKVVMSRDLGHPVARSWRTGADLRITLPKGTYKMRVLAHDLAGNAQSATKSGVLTVY